MERSKPTVEDIKEITAELETKVYNEVVKKFDEDEQYYDLDFVNLLGLPTENINDAVVLPTARDMVDTAVDHTDISNARVDVTKLSLKDTDVKKAENMRKFYLGVVYRTNVESPISPWRVSAKDYWEHGVTYIKTVYDPDRYPDKPNRKEGEDEESYRKKIDGWEGTGTYSMPIIISAIHPRCVMPDAYHIEPEFFIEKHEKAYYAIKNKFPKWDNPKERKIGETVDWIEYWDDTYKCFLADGEPVIKVGGGIVKHNYGFIPYVQIDSGLGSRTHDNNFAKRWVGLLRYMHGVLISESRGYSLDDITFKQGAFKWYGLRDDSNGAKIKKLKTLDTGYGKFNDLTGIEIQTFSPDVPAPALMAHIQMTSDIISSHAAPRSLRGLGEEGVRAASDRRLIQAEAAMKYIYSKDAFKYGAAKVLSNCARLYKYVVPGKVRLWAHTPNTNFDEIIDKELMEEPFFCHVEFAPISPEDEYRRQDSLRLLVQGLGLPVEWAWGRMPDVDPIQINEMVERTTIKNSPALVQARDTYIGQAAGLAFQQQQLGQQLQTQSQMPQQGIQVPNQGIEGFGGATGTMTTQIPQQVVPGSIQDIQQQRKAQGSQVPQFPGQGATGGGANYVR